MLFNYYLDKLWISNYINGFNELIEIIIKSKYFSSIISELFNKTKKEILFIQSDSFTKFLISKINFIPMSSKQIPFMDKFSLDIFLGGYDSNFIYDKGSNEYKEQISTILKLGNHIVYVIHEGGGHFIYAYFAIISNNYYNLNSPKIKINNKLIQNESGEQVELLLFGRVIDNLILKEALFLLNTKNHKTFNNFDEFRTNFMLVRDKKYDELIENYEGPFCSLIKQVNWKIIEDNRDFPISISSKNKRHIQPFIILNRGRNDVIGRALDEYPLEPIIFE